MTDDFTPMHLNNAGLVLLQGYLPMLFERLGLLKKNVFISEEAQQKAILALHFLATGQSQCEEHHLTLNKVLCGWPLSKAPKLSIAFTDLEKELMESLIKAIIQHWSAIGNSSVEGFRGNWLIRDGSLNEEDDRWSLKVEKRAYDILLERIPVSFSIIKQAWMDKVLYVEWQY